MSFVRTRGWWDIKKQPSHVAKPLVKSSPAFSSSMKSPPRGGCAGATLCIETQVKKFDIQEDDIPVIIPKFSQDKLPNHPLTDAVWKGSFEILDMVCGGVYSGITAHPPSKISCKAYSAMKQMPEKLHLKLQPQHEIWPPIFSEYPPDANDVAVYFFPTELNSSTAEYLNLLKRIEKQDLGLQGCLDGAEILIFASKQLPMSSHKFNKKTYLWGVFHRVYNARPMIPAYLSASGIENLQKDHLPVPEDGTGSPLDMTFKDITDPVDMEIDKIDGTDVGRTDKVIPKPVTLGNWIGLRSKSSSRARDASSVSFEGKQIGRTSPVWVSTSSVSYFQTSQVSLPTRNDLTVSLNHVTVKEECQPIPPNAIGLGKTCPYFSVGNATSSGLKTELQERDKSHEMSYQDFLQKFSTKDHGVGPSDKAGPNFCLMAPKFSGMKKADLSYLTNFPETPPGFKPRTSKSSQVSMCIPDDLTVPLIKPSRKRPFHKFGTNELSESRYPNFPASFSNPHNVEDSKFVLRGGKSPIVKTKPGDLKEFRDLTSASYPDIRSPESPNVPSVKNQVSSRAAVGVNSKYQSHRRTEVESGGSVAIARVQQCNITAHNKWVPHKIRSRAKEFGRDHSQTHRGDGGPSGVNGAGKGKIIKATRGSEGENLIKIEANNEHIGSPESSRALEFCSGGDCLPLLPEVKSEPQEVVKDETGFSVELGNSPQTGTNALAVIPSSQKHTTVANSWVGDIFRELLQQNGCLEEEHLKLEPE